MYISGEIYTFHTDTDKIFVESIFYLFELVEGFDDNDYETYSAAVGKLKCKAFNDDVATKTNDFVLKLEQGYVIWLNNENSYDIPHCRHQCVCQKCCQVANLERKKRLCITLR